MGYGRTHGSTRTDGLTAGRRRPTAMPEGFRGTYGSES